MGAVVKSRSNVRLVWGSAIAATLLLAPVAITSGSATALSAEDPASEDQVAVPAEWQDMTGGQATVSAQDAEVLAFEAANAESRTLGSQISELVSAEPSWAYSYAGKGADDAWTVGFSGAVPETVREGLAGENVLFDEQLGYTQADLEALVEEAVMATSRTLPEGATVGGGVNYQEKTLGIDVSLVTEGLAARTATPPLSTVDLLGFSPEITTVVEPEGAVDFQSYGQAGGTRVTAPDGSFCTSGFVAKSNTSNDLGILTAAHCPNSLQQGGASPFTFTSASGREFFGENGDIQFNRSPTMMDAWFHWSHGQGRPVLEVRNAYLNEGVCKYGVVSNATCGNVQDDLYGLWVTSPLTGRNTYLNGLTKVTPLNSQSGDSGGPLFGGNTAMGTLVGKENSSGSVLFTKISNAQIATNTRVCLDPVCR